MASINFAEAVTVGFGKMEAAISMTAEQRLRVKTLEINGENSFEEAVQVLSACFGEKSGAVAEFMRKNMGLLDIQRLRVYLADGPQMLATFDENVKSILTDSVRAALEKQQKEAANE